LQLNRLRRARPRRSTLSGIAYDSSGVGPNKTEITRLSFATRGGPIDLAAVQHRCGGARVGNDHPPDTIARLVRRKPSRTPRGHPAAISGGLILYGLDHLAHGLAGGPAPDAGDCIGCQNRLAVMEFQIGPQAECPDQAVRRNFFGAHHLALWLQIAVDVIEHVIDQQRAIVCNVGRGPDRIEISKISVRHEAQRAGGNAFGYGGRWKRASRRSNGCARAFQKYLAVHASASLGLRRSCRLPRRTAAGPWRCRSRSCATP